MLGSEAQEILIAITAITKLLIDADDRRAFYELGALAEKLATIVRIDQYSFDPMLPKEE